MRRERSIHYREYKVLFGNLSGRYHLVNLGVDWRTVLKWI